jgi:DNA-directed RNA polymerase subunit RPC12/RpoP
MIEYECPGCGNVITVIEIKDYDCPNCGTTLELKPTLPFA